MSLIRLEAAAKLVKNGDVLCDVGTDHAYLPIMLIKNGVIPSAIACDINPGPLSRGREHAAAQGVADRVEFVLSDGLCDVHAHFDVAAICGMGGELIIKIITNAEDKAKCRLVLQPMTGIEKVRRFLWLSGYEIYDEVFTVEGGKAYCLLAAEFTSSPPPEFSYGDTYLGMLRPNTDGFRAWAAKVRRAAQKRLLGAKDGEKENIESLITECLLYENRRSF